MGSFNEVLVRSYLIQEPKKGKPGHIWLWVTVKDLPEPMNITIPYSKQLHKQLMENKGLGSGRPQTLKKEKGKPQESDKGDNTPDDQHYSLTEPVPQATNKEDPETVEEPDTPGQRKLKM